MENKETLKETEKLLAAAERYRAYMDRIRFTDRDAKEQSRQLKSSLSTMITILLIIRSLMAKSNAVDLLPALAPKFSETLKLAAQGFKGMKSIHRDLLEESHPDVVTRLRELN